MAILNGKSFLVWASFCLTGLVGAGVAFGKLKLMSDSWLVVSLSGENEFDSPKIVVLNKLVDKFCTPHLKHSELTFLSPK